MMLDSLKSATRKAPGRFVGYQRLLWTYCFRRLKQHNAMTAAAALTFRTVFSLIPTLVLAFLILKAAGAVDHAKSSLHEALNAAGLTQIATRSGGGEATGDSPASSPAGQADGGLSVAEKIEELIDSQEKKLTFARLGPVGLVVLAWSVVTLLTTMERSLNRIFEAPRARSLPVRVLLYWSCATFVPLVLASLAFLSAKAMQWLEAVPALGFVAVGADVGGSLLLGILLLACVYRFMPNTRVPFRAALLGAALTVPIWILAKWGFALYVGKVVASGVYGALGLLPLMLMWINLTWYAFLFGAEMAYTSANLRQLVAADSTDEAFLGPSQVLAAAVAVGRSYVGGSGALGLPAVAQRLGVPERLAARLLARLADAKLVLPVAGNADDDAAYLPARPLESVRASDVLKLGEPEWNAKVAAVVDPEIARAVDQIRQQTYAATQTTTLAELVAAGSTRPAAAAVT
jgi:membrane protein